MVTSNQRETIFLSSEFKDWLKEEGLSEGTIRSYISWLTNVANEIQYKKIPNHSIFEIIEACFEKGRYEIANQLLSTTIAFITYLIKNPLEINRESKNLSDIRSAVKKYAIFIQEKIDEAEESSTHNEDDNVNDIQESEETLKNDDKNNEQTDFKDINIAGQTDDSKKGLAYPMDEIKRNFRFRLTTQDRMSKDKNLFYPIGLLKKLFYSDGTSYVSHYRNKNGENRKWFDNLIDTTIDNIFLHTENGKLRLKDIEEIVITPSENVLIKLPDNTLVDLYTPNASMKEKEKMKAEDISDIHIDHVNLIDDELEQNVDKYKGLKSLTEIIRVVKATRKLNPKNFNKIYNKVLEERYNEIKDLIPALKEDLSEIAKMDLQLMHSKHNLRKK